MKPKGAGVGALLAMVVLLSPAMAQQLEAAGQAGQGVVGTARSVTLGNMPAMGAVPRTPAPFATRPQNGMPDAQWNALKNRARDFPSPNEAGEGATEPPKPPTLQPQSDNGAFTPGAFRGFFAQNEDLFCGGVTPSDMAIAVGATVVVQAVNDCISVYDKTTGAIKAGYPKSLNAFLGFPANNFTTKQFLSDPRIFYDYVANRWVVVAIFLDFANRRGFLGLAASQTSDPTGAWFIYNQFQVGGTGQCPDFPQLGQNFAFDPFVGAITIGFNLFGCNTSGFTTFIDDVILFWPKSAVYAGNNFGFNFAFNLNVGGVLVDTIQPANVSDFSSKPRAVYGVNSFNINSGGGQCRNGCNGLVVWAFSNVLQQTGSPGLVISGLSIPTPSNYILPALGDQPGADNSIDTGDTRISGALQYSAGYLYPTINTGNGGTSAILGWKVQPFLNDNGDGHCTGNFLNACPTISKATIVEEFCYFCGAAHVGGAYYGTIQPDPEGNWTMAFNFSARSISPGTAYVSNRVSWPTPFHDGGFFLCQNQVAYTQGRWGDYTGTALDLLNTNGSPSADPSLWFAGMFVQNNRDWGTCVGANTFSLATQNGD